MFMQNDVAFCVPHRVGGTLCGRPCYDFDWLVMSVNCTMVWYGRV